MAGPGGKRAGAGRKSNAQRMAAAEWLCDFFGPAEQAIHWRSLLDSESDKVRFETARYLTDRMYGKAKEAVDMNVSGNIGLVLVNSVPRPKR